MKQLDGIENVLDDLLVKKAPFQLPETGRKTIVQWSPWINLVLGLISLWAAKSLWDLAHTVNRLADYLNSFSGAYNVVPMIQHLGFFYWLSLIVLIAEAVFMLIAVPGLMRRSKSRGWDLAFYGAIANLVYGVFYLFSGQSNTLSQFISALISSVIGFYILFQIRGYYHK